MMIDLDSVGLHGSVLLAGFSGGVCAVGSQEGHPKDWWKALSQVVVSTLTANYVAVVAAGYLFGRSNPGLELTAAFIVGAAGPWVIRGIIRKARNWTPNGNIEVPK
jgi:hypothetical protein